MPREETARRRPLPGRHAGFDQAPFLAQPTCRKTSRRCTRRLPKPSNRKISSAAPCASSTSSTKCTYYNDVQDDLNAVVARALGTVGRENDGGGFGDPVRSTRKNHGGRPLGGRRAGFRRRGAAGIDGGMAEAAAEQSPGCSRWPPPCRRHVAQMQADDAGGTGAKATWPNTCGWRRNSSKK